MQGSYANRHPVATRVDHAPHADRALHAGRAAHADRAPHARASWCPAAVPRPPPRRKAPGFFRRKCGPPHCQNGWVAFPIVRGAARRLPFGP